MFGIPIIKDWTSLAAAVNRFVDKSATGTNDGTSKTNAWTDVQSAVTDTTSSRIVAIRRADSHTITAIRSLAGTTSSLAAPVMLLGDSDNLNIWSADAGLAKPIWNLGANDYYIVSSGSTGRCAYIIANMDFEGTDTELAINAYTALWYLENCKFGNCRATIGSSTQPGCLVLSNCDLDVAAGAANIVTTSRCGLWVLNSTIDGGTYGIDATGGGLVFAENSQLGVNTAHSTADVGVGAAGQFQWHRNCKFGSTTEISKSTGVVGYSIPGFIACEDYDGVKGAWQYDGVLSASAGFDPLSLVAASSTQGQQRSGGSVNVVKSVLSGNRHAAFAKQVMEWEPTVAVGTYTVDVWFQPDVTGGAVPDTQGVDAVVWVSVAAWDTATGGYLYFDSRDEGSQDTQVDDAWRKVRISNVVADLAGTIIIRAYQRSQLAGANNLYVDRIVDIG